MPLLIVSAGISDVIEETLRSRDLLLDNITICANRMLFDEGGRLKKFRESPPVHSRFVPLSYADGKNGRGATQVVLYGSD